MIPLTHTVVSQFVQVGGHQGMKPGNPTELKIRSEPRFYSAVGEEKMAYTVYTMSSIGTQKEHKREI